MVFTSQQAFTLQCAVLTHKQALNSRSIHDFGSSRVLPMQIICKILDYVNIFLRKVHSFCEVLRGSAIFYLPTPRLWGLSEKSLGRGMAFSKVLGHTVSPTREESLHCPCWLGSLREVQDETVILP